MRADWSVHREDGVTLVGVTLAADPPRRVRVSAVGDGPVWPPRNRGTDTRWENGAVTLRVGPGPSGLGFATPGDPETVTVTLADAEPLDEELPEGVEAWVERVRRRVAETEADLERQRERVAALRGRLQAADGAAAESEYEAAVRELSEVETEHLAAKERLEAARRQARAARDQRERRLELQDRIDNLERTARAELVETVRPAVDDAVPAVPGSAASTVAEAAPVTAALAAVRVGTLRVPPVLACRRFEDAAGAESWLETPVVRL